LSRSSLASPARSSAVFWAASSVSGRWEGRVVRPRRDFHLHHPLDRLSIAQKKNLVTRKPCWSLGWVFITGMGFHYASTHTGAPRSRCKDPEQTYTFAPNRRRRERFRVKEKGSKEKELPVHHKLEELLAQYLKATGLEKEPESPLFPAPIGLIERSLCGNHRFGELASLPAKISLYKVYKVVV
jgi:hypothetical protein